MKGSIPGRYYLAALFILIPLGLQALMWPKPRAHVLEAPSPAQGEKLANATTQIETAQAERSMKKTREYPRVTPVHCVEPGR